MTAEDRWSPEKIRRLRHDIRGCMHGLMLCLAALETPMSDEEKAEFLGDVANATDRMTALMDQLDQAPEFGSGES